MSRRAGGVGQTLHEQVHDLQQLGLRQLREHDRVVDTVQELGLEVLLELLVALPRMRS